MRLANLWRLEGLGLCLRVTTPFSLLVQSSRTHVHAQVLPCEANSAGLVALQPDFDTILATNQDFGKGLVVAQSRQTGSVWPTTSPESGVSRTPPLRTPPQPSSPPFTWSSVTPWNWLPPIRALLVSRDPVA